MCKALLALFRLPFSYAGVAQLVEHRFCTPRVAGSNPVTSSTVVERRLPFTHFIKTAVTVSLYLQR